MNMNKKVRGIRQSKPDVKQRGGRANSMLRALENFLVNVSD